MFILAYKLFFIGFVLFLCACTTSKTNKVFKEDILELSETDFVVVVKSESFNTFDEQILRNTAVDRTTTYSLSKQMIPLLVSEFVEPPSNSSRGYLKQHIRLLEWDDAQIRLNNALSKRGFESEPDDLIDNNILGLDTEVFNQNIRTDVVTPDIVKNNDGSKDSITADVAEKRNCQILQREHTINLSNAIGDLCNGHRLDREYYSSLSENGCVESPKLLELAEAGIEKYCINEVE